MTEPTPTAPPMPPVPPKVPSSRKPFLAGLAVGVAASGIVAGVALLATSNSESAPNSAPAISSSPSSAVPTVEATQEPSEIYNPAPTASDFTATLKTTSKQCFGSAGCNLTVEPKLSYSGLLPLDPGKSYSITYEVRGGDDGAVIQTMELSDQTSLTFHPTVVSTAGSNVKLTVKVTDIEEQG